MQSHCFQLFLPQLSKYVLSASISYKVFSGGKMLEFYIA